MTNKFMKLVQNSKPNWIGRSSRCPKKTSDLLTTKSSRYSSTNMFIYNNMYIYLYIFLLNVFRTT